jgi:hypothetical protein
MEDFNMVSHLKRQSEWSEKTFGPGSRAVGICNHIRKELLEIEASPRDLSEWIDVVILGFDGCWRQGYSPKEIISALIEKQAVNESREWPDWRTFSNGEAIEHIK